MNPHYHNYTELRALHPLRHHHHMNPRWWALGLDGGCCKYMCSTTSRGNMGKNTTLPPQVDWLSVETKKDCFFIVGPESGETERIGAFKTLLAGHSEPLRNMLEDSEVREQGDIRIIDTEPITFKLFLKCVYESGHCDPLIDNLTFEDSVSLLYIVDKYLVSSVRKKLISHMVNQLQAETLDNCFIVLSNQVCLQVEEFRSAILKLVKYKSDLFFSHEQFLQLSAESLLFLLKFSSFDTSEVNVWKAVVKWAQDKSNSNDGQVLREHILQHLKFIRFLAMSPDEFLNVALTGILTSDEVACISKSLGDPGLSVNMTHICNIVSPRRRVVSAFLKSTLTVSYTISNISHLNDIHSCDVFEFCKLQWCIQVEKLDNKMAIYLNCKGNSTNTWSCTVEFEFILINQQNGLHLASDGLSYTFISHSNTWGLCSFYNWSDLLDYSGGFNKDNNIIVMVNMKSVIP